MKEVKEWVKKGLEGLATPLLTGPLLVVAHHLLPAPQSISQVKRNLQDFLPHINKPDSDNLEKFLNDALTGLVWDDDSRIVWMLRSKHITASRTGWTSLYVHELSFGPPNFTMEQQKPEKCKILDVKYLYSNKDQNTIKDEEFHKVWDKVLKDHSDLFTRLADK